MTSIKPFIVYLHPLNPNLLSTRSCLFYLNPQRILLKRESSQPFTQMKLHFLFWSFYFALTFGLDSTKTITWMFSLSLHTLITH